MLSPLSIIIIMEHERPSSQNNLDRTEKKEAIFCKNAEMILHCVSFCKGNFLLTMGSEGEINLYSNQEDTDWKHQTTFKAFQVPIIAYDVMQLLSLWKVVVIGYDNRVKICNIIENKEIVIEDQIVVNAKGPLIDCAWTEKGNQIYASDAKGNFHVLAKLGTWKLNCFEVSSKPLRLALGRNNKVFLGFDHQVITMIPSLLESKIVKQDKLIQTQHEVVEIAVSQGKHPKFNTLVVLTSQTLEFYHLDGNKCEKNSEFKLSEESIYRRLGWGRDYSEINLYEFIKLRIRTTIYLQKLDGLWHPIPFDK